MNIDPGGADDLRRAIAAGADIRVSDIDTLTLGAAFELAVAFVEWREAKTECGMQIVLSLAKVNPTLDRAIDALDGDSYVTPADYDAPLLEVQPAAHSLDALEWSLFGQRLRRSLEKNGGFNGSKALALSKVMSELVDNVIAHSSAAKEAAARAVVGYAIENGRMTLAVADLGRGVLASLSDNRTWRETLPDSRAALTAAVLDHASRRGVIGVEGLGLRMVQKSLIDLNGTLRFRSGDAALTLEGPDFAREVRRSESPAMAGFQVEISCSTNWTY